MNGNKDVNLAASALAQRLRESGQTVSQAGDRLSVGRHQLKVQQQIEGEAERAGKWLIGLGVQIALDGKPLPAMRSGGVGVDTTKESALMTAADEWSLEYGIVLVHALFPRPSDSRPEQAGSFTLYSGPVGLRGAADIHGFERVKPFLTKGIGAFVSGAPASDWHGITVNIAHEPQKGLTSMCQVDGRPSPPLSEAIKKLPWPSGATSYMFKQFILAVPR